MKLSDLLRIPAIHDYLVDGGIFRQLKDLCKKFALPESRSEELLDLCDAVLDEVIKTEQMPDLIGQAFGVSDDQAKSIALDLIALRLIPLANYVPQVEEGFKKLGGKPEEVTVQRIPKQAKDQGVILKTELTKLNISLPDNLTQRLIFLLNQHVNANKDAAYLQSFFSRPTTIGGLGLPEDQAKTLVTILLPLAKDIVSASQTSTVASPPKVETLPAVSPSHELTKANGSSEPPKIPVAPVVKSTPAPLSTPKVEAAKPPSQDVKQTVNLPLTPSKPDPVPVHESVDLNAAKKADALKPVIAQTKDNLSQALAAALEVAGPVLKKQKISEKVFTDIADKAIRGLRDIYQTRDLVEHDWSLKGNDLVVFMDAIKKGTDRYHAAPKPAPAPAPAPAVNTTAKDSAVLNQRFAALTKTPPGAAKVVAPLPNAQVSAARTKEEELALQTKKLATSTKPGVAQATAPPPAKAELTVGSVAIKNTSGQRKVVDVVAANRLMGPVEQLGSMTPTEFRRLSSNPDEAAQKVLDLLSTLEATSFEDRIKGVIAWRDSPVNQVYLQIAEEALAQGLALPEISSRRRSAGQESLSPAEIKALALLNAKIRF